MSKKCTSSWIKWLLVGISVGIVFIAGAAAGMRFTDARPFCGSCHVMEVAAYTHSKGSHANFTCNECHAPSDLISKIPFKAKEGIRDIMSNMSGNDVPILASLETRNVINDNCIRCHIVTNKEIASMAAKPYCTDCHQGMKHTTKKPLSQRMVADD